MLAFTAPIAGMCLNYKQWGYRDCSATKGVDSFFTGDEEWEYTLTRRKKYDWLPGAAEFETPISEAQWIQIEAAATYREEVDGSGWWITVYCDESPYRNDPFAEPP